MIKVLHIMPSYGGSGVSNLLYNYYSNFSESGNVHFDFCAIDMPIGQPFEKKFQLLGATTLYMPKAYWRRIPYLYRLFKQGNYDVVHSHIELANAVYLFIALLAGVKVRIAHAHMAFCAYSGIFNKILRIILNMVSSVKLGCSQDAIANLFGEKEIKNGIVLHNAIDIKKFSFSEDIRNRYRADYGLSKKCVIGFAGRFTYQKNVFFLLDIFESYHKRNPDSVFLMLGSGELETAFFESVEERGLSDYIIHLGNRNDVNCFMQAMDCLLLPSRWEGLGIVLIESQTASLPTVTCRETVPYIDTNITPYIKYCSFNDSSDKWCDAIDEIVAKPRKKTDDLIRNACYDITVEASKMENLYLRLCCRQ